MGEFTQEPLYSYNSATYMTSVSENGIGYDLACNIFLAIFWYNIECQRQQIGCDSIITVADAIRIEWVTGFL